MTDIEKIVAGLTDKQRTAIIDTVVTACGGQRVRIYYSRIVPGLRRKLLVDEFSWPEMLSDLGLAVRAHIMDNPDAG